MSVGLIMAGGFGKRLWPESRLSYPKQLLRIEGRESFLQATYRRTSHLFGPKNTYLIIREELKEKILSQLSGVCMDNIIAEPQGRDTAPCIGFASIFIRKRRGDIPMVVLPADHLIRNEERFAQILLAAAHQAEKNFLVTIGIKPTRAETAYGYLQIGERLKEVDGIPLFNVERFTEKPSHKKAKEFFEQGNFLWNAGIFAWKPSIILKEIRNHLPDLHQGLSRIEKALGTPEEEKVIREVYSSLPKISIDYGVMEKAKGVVAISGDFFWDDIGSWEALERIFPKNKEGNIIRGLIEEKENNNCILVNREDKVLAAIGLSNLVVINTKKGILIASKEKVQKVKDLVDKFLRDERLRKYIE
ncbi:mannose-1-phosphate guanylyltransferase [Candidatus Aerophobetes bacterium]|uniref:mannose-1-phosphate guanylyltransferase n=1 Tax=Aerophobetes bacterium TaxID=2030807 RepID=A0A662D677_UNCAE|nr:MAG: mannose-1-phosphate guanylyltransferase [Candidatus Aerophobetes bacterium]